MGQAKLRSREIAELKARGPKPKNTQLNFSDIKIHAFGAFYHDDQPDGIGVFLTADNEPTPGWTNITFHTLRQLVTEEVADTTPDNKAERIQFAWESLREHTESYNRQIFGMSTRNMNVVPHNVALTDQLIETFVGIITNIWYLETQGEIVNDDFNGMTFQANKVLRG